MINFKVYDIAIKCCGDATSA